MLYCTALTVLYFPSQPCISASASASICICTCTRICIVSGSWGESLRARAFRRARTTVELTSQSDRDPAGRSHFRPAWPGKATTRRRTHTDTQTHRHTDRHTHTHTHSLSLSLSQPPSPQVSQQPPSWARSSSSLERATIIPEPPSKLLATAAKL
jgi:hypothetical protein